MHFERLFEVSSNTQHDRGIGDIYHGSEISSTEEWLGDISGVLCGLGSDRMQRMSRKANGPTTMLKFQDKHRVSLAALANIRATSQMSKCGCKRG